MAEYVVVEVVDQRQAVTVEGVERLVVGPAGPPGPQGPQGEPGPGTDLYLGAFDTEANLPASADEGQYAFADGAYWDWRPWGWGARPVLFDLGGDPRVYNINDVNSRIAGAKWRADEINGSASIDMADLIAPTAPPPSHYVLGSPLTTLKLYDPTYDSSSNGRTLFLQFAHGFTGPIVVSPDGVNRTGINGASTYTLSGTDNDLWLFYTSGNFGISGWVAIHLPGMAAITAAITAHEAAANPHPVYTTDAEALAIAGALVASHEAASDPHPQYLTSAEGNAAYALAGHSHAASDISNTPAGGIAATTVQAAIDELDSEKAATGHTHTASNVTDFSEAVDDRVAALLVAGANITLTYNDPANTLTIAASSGGVTDGDKGDITVSGSGATWTIDNGVVTLAKMANMATNKLLGRSTAGSGAPEEISVGSGLSLTSGTLSSTGGSSSRTETASEALTAGDIVSYHNSSGAKVRKANATDNTKPAQGFVLANVSNGATGSVFGPGQVVSGLSSLTIGADYYLSTTGGGITTTKPSTVGNVVQRVGWAVSATELMFQPDVPLTVGA
ncbi:MAG: hypothetical protein U1F68_15035 [Gammaproteobacteria bacterium]